MAASDNLYIRDLPANTDDEKLKKIFSAYGVVTRCKVLPSSTPGVGKCAGLVRVQSVEEAQWIVDNLNGNIPEGLTTSVQVHFADTPESKKGGYGKSAATNGGKGKWSSPYDGKGAWGWAPPMWGWAGGGKGKGGGMGKGEGIQDIIKGLCEAKALPGSDGYDNDAETALYIAGLPADTTDLELYKIFCSFGPIPPRGVRAMFHDDGTCKGIGFVNYVDKESLEAAVATLNGTTLPSGKTLIVKPKGPGGAAKPGKGGKGGKGGKEEEEENQYESYE